MTIANKIQIPRITLVFAKFFVRRKKSTVDAKTTKTKTIFDQKSGQKLPLYLKGIQQSNQS